MSFRPIPTETKKQKKLLQPINLIEKKKTKTKFFKIKFDENLKKLLNNFHL